MSRLRVALESGLRPTEDMNHSVPSYVGFGSFLGAIDVAWRTGSRSLTDRHRPLVSALCCFNRRKETSAGRLPCSITDCAFPKLSTCGGTGSQRSTPVTGQRLRGRSSPQGT
jgi:hypothetical protein